MVNYISTVQPSNPASGETWLNPTDDIVRVYDGTTWVETVQMYQEVKRDTTGAVQFVNVAAGLTATQSGTTTTTPTGQAQFIKVSGTLGATLDTPSVVLKINGGNTFSTSVAATNTTLTFTNKWTIRATSPSLLANATVVAGTGTLTVTWKFEDRVTPVVR